MNNQRRRLLESLQDDLTALKPILEGIIDFDKLKAAQSKLEDVHANLEQAKDEEQDAYDNMTPGLQQSERGELMQQAIQRMESALTCLENLKESFETLDNYSFNDEVDEAFSNLEDARQ